jgi:hypothetical protein
VTPAARSFLVLLALGGVGALTAGVLTGRGASPAKQPAPGHNPRRTLDGRTVSEKGTLEYPNSVGHPGDPEEAVKDFKRIYAAMDAYRKKHGKLPPGLNELAELPASDPSHLTREDLQNPDWQYSEDPGALAGWERPLCDYAQRFLMKKRPDGTPLPAFPADGERDVWVKSDLAARSGTVLYPDGSADKRFSGAFVVLFSDGSIGKFKHREVFFIENAILPGPILGFPGETGYTKKLYDFADSPANKPWKNLRVSYED